VVHQGEVLKKARELLANICGAMVTRDEIFPRGFLPALEAAIDARTQESQAVWIGSLDKEVERGWRKRVDKLGAACRKCVSFLHRLIAMSSL